MTTGRKVVQAEEGASKNGLESYFDHYKLRPSQSPGSSTTEAGKE